ncbi:site-specific recombinase XerD [Chryseobacterium sp. StRB126]|uniref:hypothetical protein n=1 Tax=Chryseobacterium sp. StRB126 TaxID=878220 RepID=UPI0004E99D82|nr:hypothetical protein [Chryseobacterium sp. StRB126]BAP32626.1 site-specific recombinase XerD [Chryseobacterium sp. StRB126]
MLITLKQRKLSNGRLSLYVEYYKGSNIDDNGKRLHVRDFEYLKIYLHQNPKTPVEKKENKENQKLA